MKENTCCFTGHRKISFGEIPKVNARIEQEVLRLVEMGVTDFECGGALGFDTMAANYIINLRMMCPEVRLILILPCMDQAKNWDDIEIFDYNVIKNEADEVIYIAEKYSKDCMLERNRRLVEDSGHCICYLKKKKGGTAYTVDYAVKNQLSVINIAFP